jgi:5-formyltetrahydrofolate cyclo-ligase
MEKWMSRKNFYLPRLIPGDNFLPLPVTYIDELEKNSYGIFEPKMPSGTADLNPKLDLIIMPGVAFDQTGSRVGMGKGYYDHFLADKKGIPRIGLAYSEQVLAHVPRNTYDEPVDMIVTEKGVIRCIR